jgi:hypothetical protein
MATRFATATGVWSNTGIWDGGTLPTSADTVHPNGFTVTIDQDITIDGFNNNISAVYLPAMPIPKMTGNTQPSGTVIAGSDTSNAWKAFDQDAPTPTTFWTGTGVGSGTAWVGYNFTSAKTIKRYYIYRASQNPKPTSWTFDGSNDGTTWTTLETVTANALNTPYLSGVLANTTAYTYYRINVTAVTSGTIANIYQFEFTESTATTYGTTTGGSFTVPSSLSGTRNIVQTGEGIKTSNATILTVAATSGATVNFNISSGGYIFNQTAQRSSNSVTPLINITGNCAVNFNSNLWGWQTPNVGYITNGNINIGAAANVTVNGNIYGSKGGANSSNFDVVINVSSANAILNVIGDVYGGTNTVYGHAIISRAINTVNITGNIYGDLSAAVYSDSLTNINIIGTVNLMGINSYGAISAYIYTSSTGGFVTVNGYIVNKNNTMAIVASKLRFTQNTNPYWVFQDSAAADITLTYGAATGAYPNEADVKLGVTYAASPTRTGTCAVPLPQYVSQGVATGSTIGTAYLNAADVWNILTSTITTSGSIGERLKNASTVQTNGDQLASYIV